jgi:glycosyltransferase involved in cell wall biosynthesis
MICGLPVVTTEWTAAAGELVRHGENGYVLPLDVDVWAEHLERLLEDETLWHKLSARATHDVKRFDFGTAAEGIIDVIERMDRSCGRILAASAV